MKIVIINSILYTNETSNIRKVKTIKDTMIYNLCLAFQKEGHEPILIAGEDYKPIVEEKYNFEIKFLPMKYKKIFLPNCFPYLKNLKKTINILNPDYIISGEVFSISSLIVSLFYKNKTIIWHELAAHNNKFKKIPSIIWYNIIARSIFKNIRIVPRSNNAKNFISNYCKNVSNDIIDHGVNLMEFTASETKDKYFVVVSQLIKRKRIDDIIRSFSDFKKLNEQYKLKIVGAGDEEENLKLIVKKLDLVKNVEFTGRLNHKNMIPILSKAAALVINTEKDNSMLSIVESIACGTPIITTPIPFNCSYIKTNNLGIITTNLSKKDFSKMIENNDIYIKNCMQYREKLSNSYHVNQFIKEFKKMEHVEGNEKL